MGSTSTERLQDIIRKKDTMIKDLQLRLIRKEEENKQLLSKLDKFQSILPTTQVRKQRVGISAEPTKHQRDTSTQALKKTPKTSG